MEKRNWKGKIGIKFWKKVEAGVFDLRETIQKSVSEEIDLDGLASSVAKHSVTEEDSTDILIRMRRVGEDWWQEWQTGRGTA